MTYSLDDPVELFDVVSDPGERHDLANDPAYVGVREELRSALLARWNPVTLEQQVRRSQRERVLIRAVESGRSAEADWKRWYESGSTVPTVPK